MLEPLIVVIDNPSSLASTQVQYIPHLSHRGPMTCAKELKPCGEDSKDNYSRMLLFFGISKNEMLDSRFKNRAHLLNWLVNSMEDHGVWVFARKDPAAFFYQRLLPVLERGGAIKGRTWETCDPLRDEDSHFDQVIMGNVHWEVQCMDGPLQGRLKVNPDQVVTMSFDVNLNERPNLTLN